MDTLTRYPASRRHGPGFALAPLPAERLQALLRLSSGLLDADDDVEIMAALGRYLTSELNVAEALFLFCGEPDFACVFGIDGHVHAAADGHGLMATARASLRGVNGRSVSSIAVAQQPPDSAAALVVRWKRQSIQRPSTDLDTLLAQANELTVKAMCKLRARECDRQQSEDHHACELARRDQLEEAMRVESLTDPMTGLANRRGFFLNAEQAFQAAQRRRAVSAVIFADIDNLKLVNDQLGHETGDALIRDAATIFRQSFRRADIVARLGGDEFVAFTLDDENPAAILQRIDQNIAFFNSKTARRYDVAFSSGIVACDPYAHYGLAHYLVIADQAMYARKQLRHH